MWLWIIFGVYLRLLGRLGLDETTELVCMSVLDTPFTSDEVVGASKQMHPTKAPSRDGSPALFDQKFWNVVGLDVTGFIRRLLMRH